MCSALEVNVFQQDTMMSSLGSVTQEVCVDGGNYSVTTVCQRMTSVCLFDCRTAIKTPKTRWRTSPCPVSAT